MSNFTTAVQWRSADGSLTVSYSPEILQGIQQLAIEGLLAFRRGGLEIGGLLFGRRNGTEIEILDFAPIECQHAFGPGFRLSAADRAGIEHLLRERKQHSPVGLYLSVTRRALSLTPDDVQLAEQLFGAQADCPILVLAPDTTRPTTANFFYRLSGDCWTADPESVFEPGRPLKMERLIPPARPETKRTQIDQVPVAVVQPPLPTLTDVWVAPPEPPRQRQRAALIWLLLALLCAAGLWGSFASRPATLGLQLTDLGGQVHVQWSRSSTPVAHARRGWIEIIEGTDRIKSEFTPSELQKGSLFFVRRANRAEIRLTVEDQDGQIVEEQATVLGR